MCLSIAIVSDNCLAPKTSTGNMISIYFIQVLVSITGIEIAVRDSHVSKQGI